MFPRLRIARWLLSLPSAMFCSLAAAVLYHGVGSPPGAAALAAIVANWLLAGAIAQWIVTDAEQRHRSLPYDFDSLVFFVWWAIAPIYLFRTRGWRGFIPLGWFLLLCLAAGVFGRIGAWLASLKP